MLEVGDQVPDMEVLLTGTGAGPRRSLRELCVDPLILYFYPKNFTPGCNQEAQDFAQHHATIQSCGAQVVGVSGDAGPRHEAFQTKWRLPFALVSDTSLELCQAFGVWQQKKFMGREFMGIVRSTFLIKAGGEIHRCWRKVRVKGHAEEVVQSLMDLAASS